MLKQENRIIVIFGISLAGFIALILLAINFGSDQNIMLAYYQNEVNTFTVDDCEHLVKWLNNSYKSYERDAVKEGVAKQAQDLFFARYDRAVELNCPNLVELP